MKGALDKLEDEILFHLQSLAEFKNASIRLESGRVDKNLNFSDKPTRITLKIPTPLEASKYTAGPTFSKVAINIIVECDLSTNRFDESINSVAENLAKHLHNWKTPISCGYSKLTLDAQAPWQKLEPCGNTLAVALNFSASAVLE